MPYFYLQAISFAMKAKAHAPSHEQSQHLDAIAAQVRIPGLYFRKMDMTLSWDSQELVTLSIML